MHINLNINKNKIKINLKIIETKKRKYFFLKKKINSVFHNKTCGMHPDHELNRVYFFPLKSIANLKKNKQCCPQ
jgi:ABC-type dipeptide/oligopeptide/nickel transport system ATPase subunit